MAYTDDSIRNMNTTNIIVLLTAAQAFIESNKGQCNNLFGIKGEGGVLYGIYSRNISNKNS